METPVAFFADYVFYHPPGIQGPNPLILWRGLYPAVGRLKTGDA